MNSLITSNYQKKMRFSQTLGKEHTFFKNSEKKEGCFKVKNITRWIEKMKKQSIAIMLFRELWLENELCALNSNNYLDKPSPAIQRSNPYINHYKSILNF